MYIRLALKQGIRLVDDNKFAEDYSLNNSEIVSVRGLKLAEPVRFALKYGSEKSYEALSLDLWEQLIKPGDVVCDIGAHHGIYSLVAANTKKPKAVYAYEPAKENMAILQNNIRLNNLSKLITAHRVALSNKVGKVNFQITEASDNANIKGHPNSPTLRTEPVNTSTLDVDFQDSKLDLIKIDTDGFEPFILSAAQNIFKKNPDLIMLIEFNPKCLKRNGYKPTDFFESLIKLNFDLLLIDDMQGTITNITDKKSLWADLAKTPFFYNILCLPAGQSFFEPFIAQHSQNILKIKSLEQHIASLQKELQKAKADKQIAESRLNRIRSTKTWRYIVKPIRKTLRRK